MKKNIIILKSHSGARLANQLWNFISIYAYCLEKGYSCRNLCFFEEKKHKDKNNIITYLNYYNYFDFPLSFLLKLFINFHIATAKNFKRVKLYDRFASFIEKGRGSQILSSGETETFYLPPTINSSSEQLKRLTKAELCAKIYLNGWLFRNPAGLKKYHQEITAYFKPKEKIRKKINLFMTELKSKYQWLVGVHIRQGDYKSKFLDGKLYFSEKEIAVFLEEYFTIFKKDKNKICFIICSDEKVDLDCFAGLNAVKSDFNAVEDLFLLAKTDTIIGSNSTFGAFASYYGDIPMIAFQRDKIDWDYYKDKKTFFENKYITMVNF